MSMPPSMPNLEVGVAVLATQLTEVIKDVEGLRNELRDHREEHRTQARDQAAGRRRLWGAVLVLIGSIDGPVLAILFSRR